MMTSRYRRRIGVLSANAPIWPPGRLMALAALVWFCTDAPLFGDVRNPETAAAANSAAERSLWNGEKGAWRTKAQLLVDPTTKQLTRKSFTVWDSAPSRNLDFVWFPRDAAGSGDGFVSGSGTLLWRQRGRPPYDRSAIVGEFRGAMKHGRADGYGEYREAGGSTYWGDWVDGVRQGQGRLLYANGDEYHGPFAGGVPEGPGRYIDTTGEIYEGPFVHGRRDGVGLVRLPDGRTYTSRWISGSEDPQSRLVRLAKAGAGAGVADDVRVGLSVKPAAKDYLGEDGGPMYDPEPDRVNTYVVGFEATREPAAFAIRPDKKRLMAMWKGNASVQLDRQDECDPLEQVFWEGQLSQPRHGHAYNFDERHFYGAFALGPSVLPPLNLAVDVDNRSAAPLQVTGIYLDVTQSATDTQPAIQILDSAWCWSDHLAYSMTAKAGYSPIIVIENFGWADARNAQLRFGFVDPLTSAPIVAGRYVKSLGRIARSVKVDFGSELRMEGLPAGWKIPPQIGLLWDQTGNLMEDERDEKIVAALRAKRLFGSLSDKISIDAGRVAVAVQGILSYDWTDSDGREHHRESPFRSILSLDRFQDNGAESGATAIERVHRKPVLLRNDAHGYRLAIPFQRQVPAGRMASYMFSLDATRTSHHDFTVVVQLADGRQVRSRPVDLLLFRPNWRRGN